MLHNIGDIKTTITNVFQYLGAVWQFREVIDEFMQVYIQLLFTLLNHAGNPEFSQQRFTRESGTDLNCLHKNYRSIFYLLLTNKVIHPNYHCQP